MLPLGKANQKGVPKMAPKYESFDSASESQDLLCDREFLLAVVSMISRHRIGNWRNGAFLKWPVPEPINPGKKIGHMSESDGTVSKKTVAG
jgi:hypothetical protein